MKSACVPTSNTSSATTRAAWSGLEVREGYRFPKKDSGKVKFIAARKGVVLCYGGFSADVKFRTDAGPEAHGQVQHDEPAGRHGRTLA
ncbi:MAG: hypothetical protein ACLUNV_11235 [Sutterella wadsworthensis]